MVTTHFSDSCCCHSGTPFALPVVNHHCVWCVAMQNQQSRGNLERSSGSSISSSGLVADAAVRSHPPPPPPTPPPSLQPTRTAVIGGRSPTVKSPVLSPPPAVVTVGGQTLIVPNSKLARKVMGNEMPTSGLEIQHGASGSLSPRVAPSVVVDRQNQSSRPLSNLSVLLSQQNTVVAREDSHFDGTFAHPGMKSDHSSSSSSVARNQADEADSASGPPPTLVQTLLGRSAPDIGSGRKAGSVVAAPLPSSPRVSQYSRFRSTPTLPSTDIVRR
jgi:hypothetical protein